MLVRCLVSTSILALSILPALRADETSDKLLGSWKTKETFAGYDLRTTIAKDGGQWSIKGTFEKDGSVAGTFVGENIKVADNSLTYGFKHVKKPDGGAWQDHEVTLRMDGNGLTMSWVAKNGREITRVCERVAGPDKPKPPAKPDDKFIGTWKGRIEAHEELLTIRNANGTWSVNGKFRRNGAETGSFIGTDIKLVDGTLTFTRKFIKKPANTSWRDEAAIVVKAEGENLSYTWSAGDQKGTRALEKYVEGEKPAEDALGKLRGYWTADVATGFRVVLLITMKNDKIEVAGEYYNKKGQFAGNYVGVDCAVKDGVLTFSQKFIQKPVSDWHDGKIHTLKLLSDNVLKNSWQGGGSENFARIVKN